MEKKYKILQVHNYYQIPGGEDTVVANEKKLLEEHGHTVIQYTRNNSDLKSLSKLGKMLLPFTTIFNPKTYREIKRIIREEAIDIVHVHNTLNLISPSVYYAALKCKVPVVQTIHNFRLLCPGATFYRDGHICEDCVEHGLRCAVKHSCYRGSRVQTLACVITTLIHRMTGIYNKINYLCLTEFTRQKMIQLYPKAKNYIKPNFVYDEGGNAEPEDYYLFIGRIEEIKGVDVLIDAFAKMPGVNLKIAGTGVLDQAIQSRIEKENLTNIKLLGFQAKSEVNRLLKHARALIMCSQWYETFGMVIAEAYSNGTPVIVGNIGNIKDLVEDKITGLLFKYNSSDDLCNAVKSFERMDMSNMGRMGYRLYKSKLSPDANYRQLRQIYHIVANNGFKIIGGGNGALIHTISVQPEFEVAA